MDGRKTKLTHCIFKYRCFCFVIVTWGNEGYHRSDKIARRLSRLASFKSEGENREKCWWKVTFPDNILKAIGDCFSIYWMKWIYCQALFIFTKKAESKGQSLQIPASYRNYSMVGEYLIELIIEKIGCIKSKASLDLRNKWGLHLKSW